MIELAQHIEALLLENNCVIVPGLGGFVAHYASAQRIAEENIFLPPIRTIGFNPQLKLNDGLLVQSYMESYNTNFSDATKIVEERVTELIAMLHKEGKVDLVNVGEIRYTIYDTYEFIPYDNKITTPYLYGLDSFEMKELAVLQRSNEKTIVLIPERKKSYEIRINRTFIRNAVASVAAIALFFFLSTPVENTYIEDNNYAQLLPVDLFEKLEGSSIAMNPVNIQQGNKQAAKTVSNRGKQTSKQASVKPVAIKEIKVPTPDKEKIDAVKSAQAVDDAKSEIAQAKPKLVEGKFHIIVAGGISRKVAETMAEQLRNEGFENAKVLNNGEKVRVSIMSFMVREDATKQLLKLRENEKYENAWMLTN